MKLDIYRLHDLEEFYLNELWETYKENELTFKIFS